MKKEYECSMEWTQIFRMGHSATIKANSKEEAEELFEQNFNHHYESDVDLFDKFDLLYEDSEFDVEAQIEEKEEQ